MLAVPMFNMQGEPLGEMEIDPVLLGGRVRLGLLKQAVVAYQDHQRQRSARTKGRSDKEGSRRKLYRQKGTGNARAGTLRTPIRRGGGRAFAKREGGAVKVMPQKVRRLARNSAILAKIKAEAVLIVDRLEYPEPKTKRFAAMLSALGVEAGCLVAMHEPDHGVYRSGRNIPGTAIRMVEELNAYDVLRKPKLIFTKQAFERFAVDPWTLREASAAE